MKKRILFCIPKDASFTAPIIKTLRNLDYEVKLFDYRRGSFYSRALGIITNTFQLQSKNTKKIISNIIQQNLLKTVQTFNPDIVFVIKGESINTQTLQKIQKQDIVTINWYPDWLDSWDWIKKNASSYSFFLVGCYDVFEKLQNTNNVNPIYLPFAGFPDTQRVNRKYYNISFVGQHTPRREEYLKAIRDLNLHIWGYKKWQSSSLAHIANPSVSAKKTLSILRHTKIAVNILSGSNHFQPKALNVRTFEATSVGTFLLLHENSIIRKHFDVKKEIITFKSPADLRKKVIYYLQHDKKRETIAKAGWKRVKQDHTYENRLKKIFSLVYRCSKQK